MKLRPVPLATPPAIIESVALTDLKENPRYARLQRNSQIQDLMRSIEAFGFILPVLIDETGMLITGHVRCAAARKMGMTHVPVIRITHLSPEKILAFSIADNQLSQKGRWNETVVAKILLDLTAAELDFSIEATGFTMAEVDVRIESLDMTTQGAGDDLSHVETGPAVTELGDLWGLGKHKLICGSATEATTYDRLMTQAAAAVFADPPYNVPVNGHISGSGKTQHREFVEGSGELSPAEYLILLRESMRLSALHCRKGSIHFWCIDWRHDGVMQQAAEPIFGGLKNLCVWVKDNAGMGSLYRSAHELVHVYKLAGAAHRNNVQLGRYGRPRSNAWRYPAPSHFQSCEDASLIALHPTVKPVALIADAILDVTARGDVVLDPFCGSGSSLLACQRVGRVGRAIELDPLYVDLAIRRWQSLTGEDAIHLASGQTFNQRASEVGQ